MAGWSETSSSVPSLPPPRPKSPPEYPDLYGKRREMAKVQMLEREISFLKEELKSINGLQESSRCCKEVTDFVMAKPDPLIPSYQNSSKSCRFWKWLCGWSCFNLSWICCCCYAICPLHLEVPCSCQCKSCTSCNPCASCKPCTPCSPCASCTPCASCKSCTPCASCKSCTPRNPCAPCKSCTPCKCCKSCMSCESCSCPSCISCSMPKCSCCSCPSFTCCKNICRSLCCIFRITSCPSCTFGSDICCCKCHCEFTTPKCPKVSLCCSCEDICCNPCYICY